MTRKPFSELTKDQSPERRARVDEIRQHVEWEHEGTLTAEEERERGNAWMATAADISADRERLREVLRLIAAGHSDAAWLARDVLGDH